MGDSFFRGLVSHFHFHVIDACEYGSDHRKSTGILAMFLAPRLQMRCAGTHKHASWKIHQDSNGEWSFDTAKEAEYPVKFARELASAFLDELSSKRTLHLVDDVFDHAVKISAESQPRRPRGPLLLSEFKTKVAVTCACTGSPPEIITEDVPPPWQGVPVGSKRLETQPVSSEQGCEAAKCPVWCLFLSRRVCAESSDD